MVANQTIVNDNFSEGLDKFASLLKTSFSNAGFLEIYDEVEQFNNRIIVYNVIFDSNKTFGSVFLKLEFSLISEFAVSIFQELYPGWDADNHQPTGSDGSLGTNNITFNRNVPLEIRSYNGGEEFKLIAVAQGYNFALLGYIRPEVRHPVFDDNICPYVFQSDNNWYDPFKNWMSTTLNPFGDYQNSRFTSSFGADQLAKPNPITNKRDILNGVIFYSYNNVGVAGQTSSNIISVAAEGLAKFDSIIVEPGIEEYILLYPGNGCMGVRVV